MGAVPSHPSAGPTTGSVRRTIRTAAPPRREKPERTDQVRNSVVATSTPAVTPTQEPPPAVVSPEADAKSQDTAIESPPRIRRTQAPPQDAAAKNGTPEIRLTVSKLVSTKRRTRPLPLKSRPPIKKRRIVQDLDSDEVEDDDEEDEDWMPAKKAKVLAASAHQDEEEEEDEDEPLLARALAKSGRTQARRGPGRGIPFADRLESLKDYKREHGHLFVPCAYLGHGGLGPFVHNLRTAQRQGRLSAEELAALDEIGFRWDGYARYQSFEKRLKELKIYLKTHGHLFVPIDYKEQGNLGAYVADLRRRRKGTCSGKSISKQQIAALNEIGFEWSGLARYTPFEERLQELIKYKEKFGNLLVPAKYREQDRLGQYVCRLRARHQGREGQPISPEEKAALDALGFEWDPNSLHLNFEQRLQTLRDYKAENGHLRVPYNYKGHHELGKYAMRIRKLYHGMYFQGRTLKPAQIKALNEIGFCWNTNIGKDKRRKQE